MSYKVVIKGVPTEKLATQLKELNEHAIRFEGAADLGLVVMMEVEADGS